MNQGWYKLGFLVIALAVGACQSRAAAEPGGAPAAPATSTASSGAATSVLLMANLSEADDPCTCGEIIRAVRAAAARGVKTREVDTRNKDEKSKVANEYGIVVTPTVLLLDSEGHEANRVEGESKPALERVKTALDKLSKKR